jgi:hypothetical protein
MMERKGERVMLRNEHGERESHKHAVLSSETALNSFRGRRPWRHSLAAVLATLRDAARDPRAANRVG